MQSSIPYISISTKYITGHHIVIHGYIHIHYREFQVELSAMANEYGTCPICMEDYDLDTRIPKSLDCRHSLCKLCLQHSGQPLNSCPICRQPVRNHTKIPNDFTMIEYLQYKDRDRHLNQQEPSRTTEEESTSNELKEVGHTDVRREAHAQVGHTDARREPHAHAEDEIPVASPSNQYKVWLH